MNRQFNPPAPNMAYAPDIAYIPASAGWLYLAIVLDLYARKAVAWAMAPSMPAKPVCDVLNMASNSDNRRQGWSSFWAGAANMPAGCTRICCRSMASSAA